MCFWIWWKTGRNTGDGQNMTQELGAQENCDSCNQHVVAPLWLGSQMPHQLLLCFVGLAMYKQPAKTLQIQVVI
jgi:hypothetical protein